jgi:hypothetical protein
VSAAIVVALVVALGGWVLAGVTAWLSYKTSSDQNFYHALDWLSGGTQKRNLGIAAIEASWHTRRFRRLSAPLLCNSAIYLLLRSDSADSPNELSNLYRMMAMVTNVVRIPQEQELHYRMLSDALGEKLSPGFSGGLEIPASQLSQWQTQVASVAGRRRSARSRPEIGSRQQGA